MKKVAKFVYLGAPGAGKGTYAKIICDKSNGRWRHLSPGDYFRREIANVTPLGKELSSYVRNGKLVPGHVMINTWLPVLGNVINELESLPASSSSSGVILDGFPRSLKQCEALDSLIPSGKEFFVVNINLRKDIIISKLLGRCHCRLCGKSYNTSGISEEEYDMPAILPNQPCSKAANGAYCTEYFEKRSDDTEEVIKKRLEDYFSTVQPIVDYYARQERLVEIELKKGVKDVDKLWSFMLDRYNKSQGATSG